MQAPAIYSDLNQLFGLNAYPELLINQDAVRGSLFNLLTTPLGTRVFVPEYGSRLHEFIHEPIDEITASQIELFLIQAIRKWEPRIKLDSNGIAVLPTSDGFYVKITYTIIATNLPSSFELAFNR